MTLTDSIKQEAFALGFDTVGIARVDEQESSQADADSQADARPASVASLPNLLLNRLTEWLRRGYHGTMAWMGRDPAKRSDPRLVLPGCRSIISVGLNYLTDHRADERPGYGRIARYAWGRDYHKVFRNRLMQLEKRIKNLAPDAHTRSYADTGPLMEKAWAERAGLGWIGKHSNLVSADYGSWLLLGEVLTTLALDPDEPATDLCGSCSLCIQACPTSAIVEPYVVDATRCISYLTIEWRGLREEIPADIQQQMGNKIFGCDDCLDVCPFNLRAEPTKEQAFQPTPLALAPNLDTLSGLDESTFSTLFQQSPIRRAKLDGLRRNITIARQNLKLRPSLIMPASARNK
ncbi:MAG: tRNA epoxyqueuosine(34) reductase QueG [Nitrospira sp.]|nr:tRNA epoxyqueuosine(34) reductase QueG [Nitrospira sp.]MCP9442215.1 tRNA epoxyqueuosine(34) reductase QueG [Nitrospira sp.]